MESVNMNELDEKRLIVVAKEIVMMPDGRGKDVLIDSAMVLTDIISRLNIEDFVMLKKWYEQVSGRELKVVRDVIDLRNCLVNFLEDKGIVVPKKPKYESQQKNVRTSSDYMRDWNNDSISLGRGRK